MSNRVMVQVDRQLRRVFPKVSVELTSSLWADTIRVYVGLHTTDRIYCGEFAIPPDHVELYGNGEAIAAQLVYEILRGIAGCKPSSL